MSVAYLLALERRVNGAQFLRIQTIDARGRAAKECDRHQPIRLEFEFVLRKIIQGLYITFSLQTIDGLRVLFSDCFDLFDVKSPRGKRPVLAVPVAWEIDSFRRIP